MKQGLEEYSRSPDGALYTYEWALPDNLRYLTAGEETFRSPMNEEPLKLIPPEWRDQAIETFGLTDPGDPWSDGVGPEPTAVLVGNQLPCFGQQRLDLSQFAGNQLADFQIELQRAATNLQLRLFHADQLLSKRL